MHEKPDNIMKKTPFSNNTISRSIDEMANDAKHQLISIPQRSEFSIQMDESTVVDNQCLMMVYVRYFSENLQPCEEMLFTEKLPLDLKGATIFHTVKSFLFEHNIPLSNILACASDGAPSMIVRYRGFSSLLKREISHQILTVHCLAQRKHLVAKNMNGNRKTLIDCKSFITSFISELVLFKTNISKRQFHQFPQLDSLKDELVDEDLTAYRSYLQSLHDNMVERFQDVFAPNIQNWHSNPFEVDAVN
ncbi:protein ZBED8-like [Octopus sinensis]|uniref:Protein ZBED8-like n=1 Tax=Octopus sinensis TaxID=2607531 RepID=A0A6P7SND1_9MOLL|nr:protein ZBED8-like [Octopus sinensis]